MASVRRISILVVAVAGLVSFGAAAGEEPEIERVSRAFVALSYDGRAADAAALSISDAKGREELERQVRNFLRVRCVSASGIAIIGISRSGDRATVEMNVVLRKSAPDTTEMTPLRLRLVQTAASWRIAAVEFPEAELAELLFSAKENARAQLIEENRPRLTPNVVRLLNRRLRLASGVREPDLESHLALVRDVSAVAGGPALDALVTLSGVDVAKIRGDFSTVTPSVQHALSLAETSGDPDALAAAWLWTGVDLTRSDQYAPAVSEAYSRSLAFAERSEDPIWLVFALHSLAGQEFIRGDSFATRVLMERSRPFLRDAADPFVDLWFELQLSMIYSQQSDRDMAVHHLQQAMDLARKSNAWMYAFVVEQLAEKQLEAGRLGEAERLLAESRARIGPSPSVLRFLIDEKTAIIAANRGRFEEAECLMRQAAAGWARAGVRYGPAFDDLAPLLAKARRHRDALRLSLEMIPDAETRLRGSAVRAMVDAATAYHVLGFDDRAQSLVEEAIALREPLDEQISGGDQQRILSGGATTAIYELAAELASSRGDVRGALAQLERGRGRVLYDIVAGGMKDTDSRAALVEHERNLARLNLELVRAVAASETERAARLRDELEAARRDYQTLADGLRDQTRRRSGARAAPPLDDVLRKLPPHLAAVSYVVRDDFVSAFIARKNAAGETIVRQRRIAIGRTALERDAARLVTMIGTRDLRYRAPARRLYERLIAPLAGELAHAETLCIVPDEILWRVPFAALVDGDGKFLVERWAVTYAPSITLYAEMKDAVAGEQHGAANVLAVANPATGLETRREMASYYRDLSFGALPDAEREADAVCALYGTARCVVLEREKATETRLRSAIERARILHFATHGVFDDRDPMYSRLLLAHGDGALDDGLLEAREIAALNLHADLVVLSACDTARGAIGGGEGVVGMAWSFFAAGARSMVATQWKVASKPTADLMIAFHRALRARDGAPHPKTRALREAQLRLLREPATRHPFYWAGFVLLGDS